MICKKLSSLKSELFFMVEKFQFHLNLMHIGNPVTMIATSVFKPRIASRKQVQEF